jgi:ribosome-binding factor A
LADSVRIRRVAEEIRAELSQILREEVRDPRVGLVTITRVKLAPDLGAATVFYSPLVGALDEGAAQRLREAMQAVAGFARRLLARRMNLRHTPELRFVLDDSIAAGSETLALIRSLEIEPEPESEPEPEESSAPCDQEGKEDGEKESTQ